MTNYLVPFRDRLDGAYLFGSYILNVDSPNDIDLVLVTLDKAGSLDWLKIRMLRTSLSAPFYREFGIPLSAMVLTSLEWRELKEIMFRHRKALW